MFGLRFVLGRLLALQTASGHRLGAGAGGFVDKLVWPQKFAPSEGRFALVLALPILLLAAAAAVAAAAVALAVGRTVGWVDLAPWPVPVVVGSSALGVCCGQVLFARWQQGLSPHHVVSQRCVLAVARLGAVHGCLHAWPQSLLGTVAALPVFAGPIFSVGFAAAAAVAVLEWKGVWWGCGLWACWPLALFVVVKALIVVWIAVVLAVVEWLK